MKPFLKIFLSLVVLGGAGFGGKLIIDSAKAPERQHPPAVKLTVDAVRLKRQEYRVVLHTRGTVRPRTESTLIPEVSGRVTRVSPDFREGGFFEEGDILLEIDPRDYEAARAVAQATLVKAKVALKEEQIRAKSKETEVTVAKSALAKAQFALEEEKIRALNRKTEVAVAKSALAKAQLARALARTGKESRGAALTIAKADLAKARLVLEEEKARCKQALENWKKLGDGDPPGDLVIRKPQLDSAQAAVAAAEAHIKQRELDLSLVGPELDAAQAAVGAAEAQLQQREWDLALVEPQIKTAETEVDAARAKLQQREWDLALVPPQLEAAEATIAAAEAELARRGLDLERTKLEAPYAGRVLSRNVDLGQFVSPGAVLARIYAVDYAEVRLPLSGRQLEFVDLPHLYRGESVDERSAGPKVGLRASVGRQEHRWEGQIVRTEGAVDIESRQLFVTAQVDDPYGKAEPERPPLRVGLFVEAEIEGHLLKDVFVIPRSALREGDEVLIVNQANELLRREIEVVWGDTDRVVVREGVKDGEVLCLTAVTFATERLNVEPRIREEGSDE